MSVSHRRMRLHALAAATAVAVSTLAAPAFAGRVELAGLQSAEQHDQFIVRYLAGSPERNDVTKAKGKLNRATKAGGKALSLGHLRRMGMGADVVRADRKLDRVEAEALMHEIAADPNVDYVEIDARMYAMLVPNDTSYSQQWGFNGTYGIKAEQAWDLNSGLGAVVAVIDTGITNHSDLNANILPGYDFISDATSARDGNGRDSNPADEGDWSAAGECYSGSPASNSSWHGTHVTGTVAAVTNNAKGVAGTAFNAKVVPVRVLGKCGGSLSDIADAITWASGGTVTGVPANANPAEVINMSLGGSGTCGTTYQAAIDGAVARGTTVVVAAGNGNTDVVNSRPANCNNVIAVASITSTGARSSFSNYGSGIDIAAPGSSIYSTLNAGTTTPGAESYASYNGTSMATPHVAGVVALIQSHATTPKTPAEIESLIKANVTAFPSTPDKPIGPGILNAKAVLDATNGTTPPPSSQLLANPGFESGNVSWTSTSGVITNSTSRTPRTGSWYAWLDGYGTTHTDTLSQSVAIPSGKTSATLTFYLKIDTAETTTTTAYDKLTVQVLNSSGSLLKTCATYSNLNKSTSYSQKSCDLTAYIGQTVTIKFTGTEDSSAQTSFLIDDTALNVQ